jgi:hypothetical protein
MRTTRPTDDDLCVIVQTLAISGSLGQDDGIALLREIDYLRQEIGDLRADLEAAERDRERLRVALQDRPLPGVDQAEYAPEDAPGIARDALAPASESDAGGGT